MPFKSRKQMLACFASNGFNGKVDCKKWVKHTKNIKALPKSKRKKQLLFLTLKTAIMKMGTKGQKHTPAFPKVKSSKTKMAKITPTKMTWKKTAIS